MTHLRTLLTAFLFFSFVFNAQAQWSVGISGGGNVSFWYWHLSDINYELDFNPWYGWRAAIPVEYKISPAISLRAEFANQVISNSNKTKLHFPMDPFNGDIDAKTIRISEFYNSVGGSLLVRVSPIKKHRNLYLLAGPTMAYFTHRWWRLSSGLAEGDDKPQKKRLELNSDGSHRLHWFTDAGLGYALPFKSKNHLFFEFRYQYDLTNFARSSNVETGLQTLIFNFGYLRNF